jgi:hypothetical protein
MAVANGQLVILATETSADAAFQTDTCATTQLQLGSLPTGVTMPDYSGMGMFTAAASAGGSFNGPIAGGKFNSASPVTTKSPVSVTIKLPLVPNATPVTLNVIGAHLQFTRGADGKITGGQLHGAIKNTDVQGDIIPNVAMLLTQKINDPAGGATATQIENIFDVGGCPGAMAKDKRIDPCEVANSGLIKNVLAPDVQMFAADGVTYKPNPDNTTKDSLSLGIAFTMVGAKF